MSNKTFDVLKEIALVWLPALGTLWFALAQIWKFPYAEEILGSITALDCFLGALLGVSTSSYRKGITETMESHTEAIMSDSEKEEKE